MKKELNYATFYRVLGMFFILLCHFTQESINPYLNMSAQLFNIGVDMFFILSGFLFGVAGGQRENSIDWYGKRIWRIYVPYELFVIILLIVHLFCGKLVLTLDWLWLFLGLQGSVVGVLGAEQTWFITSLLLCYMITPLLDRICQWISTNKRGKCMYIAVLILTPIGLALIPPAYVSTLFSSICWYGLAFFVGRKHERIQLCRKYAVIAFAAMCVAFGIRLTGRARFDGTVFYDRIIVGYTHVIAAYAIFYMVAVMTYKIKPGRVITYISAISFEIYLYHYMFTVGPIRLFAVTNNWAVNCVIVTVLTICIAGIMNRVSRIIKRTLP